MQTVIFCTDFGLALKNKQYKDAKTIYSEWLQIYETDETLIKYCFEHNLINEKDLEYFKEYLR